VTELMATLNMDRGGDIAKKSSSHSIATCLVNLLKANMIKKLNL